jgi:ABC-type branched-subunit amino acid transport system ATPase component
MSKALKPSDEVPLLHVEHLAKAFGGVRAVQDVSFSLTGERVVGLIGPNGSGKSTLFNLLSGVTRASSGTVSLRGRDISRTGSDSVFRLGMSRTFQNTRLFPRLTVSENVLIGALSRGLGPAEVEAHLDRLGLGVLSDSLVSALSYGDRKLVELATGLIGRPALLLLDEPLAGVHESVIERISDIIASESKHMTVFIVEHNVPFVMKMCERVLVMNRGELLADGTPAEVRHDRAVVDAYFGGS